MYIDVTRFSHASTTSGIPRLVDALVRESRDLKVELLVHAGKGFARVDFNSDTGSIIYPAIDWDRKPIQIPLQRFYISLSRIPVIGAALFTIFRLSPVRFLSRWFLSTLQRLFQGKPKRYVDLSTEGLLIAEIPAETSSRKYLELLNSGQIEEIHILVHDLLPITHPHYFDTSASVDHLYYAQLFSKAKTLICGTQLLAEHLNGLLGVLGQEFKGLIKVIELPSSMKSANKRVLESTSPNFNFLFVGAYQARKGLTVLLDAIEDGLPENWKIAIVGVPRPTDKSEMDAFFRASRYPNVRQTGNLTDSQLLEEFVNSDVILYLSEAEGFGMPVVEAISCERPVVARRSRLNELFESKYPGVFLFKDQSPSGVIGSLKENMEKAISFDFPHDFQKPNTPEEWSRQLFDCVVEPAPSIVESGKVPR